MKPKKIHKIALVCSLLPYIANSDVVKHSYPFSKHYEIYTVKGRNLEQVDASFEQAMPSWLYSAGFDAYTKYQYDFNIDEDTCHIHRFSFEVTYTLPQLVINEESKQLKQEYESYLNKLYRHEEIHCAISMEIVDKMYDAARYGLNNPKKCALSLKQIRIFENTLLEVNKQFDRETNHGEFPDRSSLLVTPQYIDKCKIERQPFKIK
ncbi:DUF922 domain-containing protein [Vibrio crassostreae]|nr:DUF922 domain-containing protein [Vibrio crassostreae]CAK2044621.1 DUF922 domain-containing protein [Vibrio crassostreae]CAK2052592.1 DUF922 domain-containing protein [Vibrio crassostreae]CAK2332054.1 DUF922 domain-containing protein [Vibrio crassostreae]CAK2909974.1 DUF922 domain-containing protein [Vibrio crassostreae]